MQALKSLLTKPEQGDVAAAAATATGPPAAAAVVPMAVLLGAVMVAAVREVVARTRISPQGWLAAAAHPIRRGVRDWQVEAVAVGRARPSAHLTHGAAV